MSSVKFSKNKLYDVNDISVTLHNLDNIDQYIPLYTPEMPIVGVHPSCSNCESSSKILNHISIEYMHRKFIEIDAMKSSEIILSNFIQVNNGDNVVLHLKIDVYLIGDTFKNIANTNGFPIFKEYINDDKIQRPSGLSPKYDT